MSIFSTAFLAISGTTRARALAMRLPRLACLGLLVTTALAGCKKDYTAYALTSTGDIIEFATNKPTSIGSKVTVTGLTAPDALVQLAYLPTTAAALGTLYGVTTDNELCNVEPTTGVVSLCSAAFYPNRLSNVAVSFDPVGKDLRLTGNDSTTSSGRVNLLIPVGSTYDKTLSTDDLSYSDSTNGVPQMAGIAYTNPLSSALQTTLYALDVNNQSLDRIGDESVPANNVSVSEGGVHTIGVLGVTITTNSGFAIAPQDGTAYAVLGNAASLYTIDLGSGAATLVGAVHDADYTLISLVIAPNS